MFPLPPDHVCFAVAPSLEVYGWYTGSVMYDHKDIEGRWRERWDTDAVYQTSEDTKRRNVTH